MIDSYAADLIHGVTRGEFMTAKHFLLALGLHSLTGKKKIVEILHGLGHCISYSNVCEIETAQAQVAQIKSENSSCLPLNPLNEGDIVLTFFWVDNFDCIVETQIGGGSINSTHMMAFQEISPSATPNEFDVNIDKTRTRTLEINENFDRLDAQIDSKKEPPLIDTVPNVDTSVIKGFIDKFMTWMILRKFNAFDQIVPSFSGWLLNNRIQEASPDSVKELLRYIYHP